MGHAGVPSAPNVTLSLSKGDVVRSVWTAGALVNVPVLHRDALETSARVNGPAIVEEYDCTTYVAPHWSLVAGDGVLVLERTA